MNDTARPDFAAADPRARIRVELGARSYDIAIGPGALDALAEVRALRPHLKRVFAVSDETVQRLHGPALRDALARAGLQAEMVILPPGEAAKSFAELERLCDALLAKRIERNDVIVAFGGGVIGDLAGFAASIVLRGVDYVQVPTTLLAQVDSSVGGKTAIDTRHGKNLVGAFHQPRLVAADTALLDTLPRRERLAGYAEIAKYGLVGNAGFFAWLERAAPAVVDRAGPERTGAVSESCRAKARIVGADEREAGERALLNFGHTFAHALETECGYDDTLRHGEAVALGMAMAFDLSAALGLCAPEAAERVHRHFAAVGLPTSLQAKTLAARRWPAERLVQHMQSDKKVRGGKLTFVLARAIGQAFVAGDVPADRVLATLRAHGAA
jgi:3-dehydroquinate synthase